MEKLQGKRNRSAKENKDYFMGLLILAPLLALAKYPGIFGAVVLLLVFVIVFYPSKRIEDKK